MSSASIEKLGMMSWIDGLNHVSNMHENTDYYSGTAEYPRASTWIRLFSWHQLGDGDISNMPWMPLSNFTPHTATDAVFEQKRVNVNLKSNVHIIVK